MISIQNHECPKKFWKLKGLDLQSCIVAFWRILSGWSLTRSDWFFSSWFPELKSGEICRYWPLTMTSLVWMERSKEMGWRVWKSRCKNYSSLKESVEVPGSGLEMGWTHMWNEGSFLRQTFIQLWPSYLSWVWRRMVEDGGGMAVGELGQDQVLS